MSNSLTVRFTANDPEELTLVQVASILSDGDPLSGCAEASRLILSQHRALQRAYPATLPG
jgi:hypothetical protein